MNLSPRLLWTAFIAVVCIIALIAVVSFLSDPFGFKARKIERLQREAETAQSEAYARTLESEGRAGQLDRLETYHREVITIQSATASAVTEARSATDANTPLDPARADRLRRADDSLCAHATCPASSAPADAPTG